MSEPAIMTAPKKGCGCLPVILVLVALGVILLVNDHYETKAKKREEAQREREEAQAYRERAAKEAKERPKSYGYSEERPHFNNPDLQRSYDSKHPPADPRSDAFWDKVTDELHRKGYK